MPAEEQREADIPTDDPSPASNSSRDASGRGIGRSIVHVMAQGFGWLLGRQKPDYCGCRLGKLLGVGSYGKVFEGFSPVHGPVAIKICLTKVQSPAPISLQRFEREIHILKENWKTLACLPKYYDDGTTANGLRYYLMERLHGQTLLEWRNQITDPEPSQLLRISIALTEAVGSLHDVGIIHRDLGPGNIWITAGNGPVRILDVGLALPLDAGMALTAADKPATGNPFITDPVVHNNQQLDRRSDLFSIGCNLFRLWTGAFPWPGDRTGTSVAHRVPPTPVGPHRIDDLIPGFRPLVGRLIQPIPEERPQRYTEVLVDLYRLAADSYRNTSGRVCAGGIAEFRKRFEAWVRAHLEFLFSWPAKFGEASSALNAELERLTKLVSVHSHAGPSVLDPIGIIRSETTAYLNRIEGIVRLLLRNPGDRESIRAEIEGETAEIRKLHSVQFQLVNEWLAAP